jgi:hypothetical protein
MSTRQHDLHGHFRLAEPRQTARSRLAIATTETGMQDGNYRFVTRYVLHEQWCSSEARRAETLRRIIRRHSQIPHSVMCSLGLLNHYRATSRFDLRAPDPDHRAASGRGRPRVGSHHWHPGNRRQSHTNVGAPDPRSRGGSCPTGVGQTNVPITRLQQDRPAIGTSVLLVKFRNQRVAQQIRKQNTLSCAIVIHAKASFVNENTCGKAFLSRSRPLRFITP